MGARPAAALPPALGRAGGGRRARRPRARGGGAVAARPRAKRGEGERLRAEIVEAASRLLLRAGDADAVSMRAVANVVGVSPPAIYLHFANKDELLREVCADRFRMLHDHLEAAVAGVDDPVEELRRRGQAYVDFGLRHPEHYRLLFMTRNASMDGPDAGELDISGFADVVRNVERCIEAGAFEPVDPVLATTALWAAVHGVTSLAIAMPQYAEKMPAELQDHVLHVLVRGLRA